MSNKRIETRRFLLRGSATLKTCQFNFSLEWDFFERKPKYLQVEKRHFLRVPTILNSQTVYDTYETKKK